MYELVVDKQLPECYSEVDSMLEGETIMRTNLLFEISEMQKENEQIKLVDQKIKELGKKKEEELKKVKKKYQDDINGVKKTRNNAIRQKSKKLVSIMQDHPDWHENVDFYRLVDDNHYENFWKKSSLLHREFQKMFKHPLIENFDMRSTGLWGYPLPTISLSDDVLDDEIENLVNYIEPFFNSHFAYRRSSVCNDNHGPKVEIPLKCDDGYITSYFVLHMNAPNDYRIDYKHGVLGYRDKTLGQLDNLTLFEACAKAREVVIKDKRSSGF